MLTSQSLSLRDYVATIRRHRLVIVLITVVGTGIGLVPAMFEEPVYSSSSTIQVKAETAQSPFDEAEESFGARSRELATAVELIRSSTMRALVQERLRPGAPLFHGVSASVAGASEIIVVEVRAPTPSDAADVANAYAEAFVEQRRASAVDALVAQSEELRARARDSSQQIAAIDARLADGSVEPSAAENLRFERTALAAQVLEFTGRADELEVEAALRRDGTQIVSRARLHLEPISPKPLRSAVIGGALGLLAGLGLAALLDIVQDRVGTPADLERVDASVPILASIPHHDVGAAVRDGPLGGPATEAYRYLRTSVRYMVADWPTKAIVVTSATAAEGKTTTAVNLARAAAESGARVVFIDADLRRPTAHGSFALSNRVGLSEVLGGQASFAEAVQYVDDTLAVLTAGSPTPLAPDLLGSETFTQLIRSVSDQSDLLVIDAPPVLPVADPILVAKAAGQVILVARIGVVRRRELRETLRRLEESGVNVGGFVANDVEGWAGYGDYAAYANATP